MPTALFTHHHYGWRRHDLPDASEESLRAALLDTHDFLREFAGNYRIETERTFGHSGTVHVIWNGQEARDQAFGPAIRPGETWFQAFEFNVARADACRYCGGSGVDHYTSSYHCWACDGTARKVRDVRPIGFRNRSRALSQFPDRAR